MKRVFFTKKNPVIYALDASAHGLGFVRDQKLYTKANALDEARRWESIADTVGGVARVVNTITQQLVYSYGKEFAESL